MNRQAIVAFTTLILLNSGLAAQTVYVTDQLQVGLHADKEADSPIVKVIPTGTPLEIVRAEERLSFVRGPDGVSGWVDNSYLAQEEPGSVRLPEAEARISELEESLARAELMLARVESGTMESFEQERDLLEQQLKSERVKTGELQVQIAELRKRLGQDGNNDSLYEKIDQLAMENKQLQIQLARILETGAPDNQEFLPDQTYIQGFFTPRNILISMGIILVGGIILGLYIMDLVVRRRHGGFRV